MNRIGKMTFIGAGNMAKAIIGGLIQTGISANDIKVTAPSDKNREALSQRYGIETSAQNNHFIDESDVLLLSVKPQVMEKVCREIAVKVNRRRPLIISIAAGITSNMLADWLGDELSIVRCMPNTPAQIHSGASGLFSNENVSLKNNQQAELIFSAVGIVEWVKNEADLHTVTALSGSGPAYCFLILEALESAAHRLGLDSDSARRLATQTMLGAAKLAQVSTSTPADLKKNVMSPGGTTEKAIKHFEQQGLHNIIEEAVEAAWQRSYELAGASAPNERTTDTYKSTKK